MNKIAFIGAGAMAEAILSGILKQELIKKQDIFVTNKSNRERLKHIKNTYKVKTSTNKKAVVQNANIILLSMKPQDLQEAAKQIRDRKSTRLNSSHVAISYAVFCLKKNKTTQQCLDYY